MNVSVFIRHIFHEGEVPGAGGRVGATPGALPSQTERESSLPSPARPAERLRGREQRAKRPGSRLCHAGRGADTGNGTVCPPTCREHECTPVPLRRHPRLAGWPDTATPTFPRLPGGWNSGKGEKGTSEPERWSGELLGTPRASLGPSVAWMQPHGVGAAGFLSLGLLSLPFPVRLPNGTPCCPRSQDPALEDDVLKASLPV